MSDHDHLREQLATGDWTAAVNAIQETPELLEARFTEAEQTPLHLAVIAGRRDVVEALLDLGADVMARDGADRATPLHWAADRGDLDLVELLVARGAELDASDDVHGWGPLGWAALGELRSDVARWLLAAGARPRLFPLIALDDGEAVASLIAEDPAVLEERMSLWEHYECPLHFAIALGALSAFEALVAAGADIGALDWVGLSPLAVAGFHGRDAFALRLEERGVTPDLSAALAWAAYESAAAVLDAEPGALAPKARYGRLLMFAAENDHVDAARWLIDHGADPDAVHDWWDNRLTALHPAASHGSLEVVRLLVEHGADPGVHDQAFDATPLEWAHHFEEDAVVDYLEGIAPRQAAE